MKEKRIYREMDQSERRIVRNRIRRKRQIRRNILVTGMAVFLILSLSATFFSFRSKAGSDSEQIMYKYFKSISVSYGDTLSTYADDYNVESEQERESYIQEIMRINHLEDETIRSGEYLIVPYYSSEFIG